MSSLFQVQRNNFAKMFDIEALKNFRNLATSEKLEFRKTFVEHAMSGQKGM